MVLLRNRTFDAAIWSSVLHEYPDLPRFFAPGETLVDVGCHTGAVCMFAAERGAAVIGFEASLENFVLAVMNLRGFESVKVHQRAVWRSDLEEGRRLLFTPSADTQNTGGGSVMFSRHEDHWLSRPIEGGADARRLSPLSERTVPAVALDEVLMATGPVRVLKLDVEGAEFPILLSARHLDLVELIVGEYHEFDQDSMALLAPDARVGDEPYTPDLLSRCLETAGFDVDIRPRGDGRGYFKGERRSMLSN